jgi:hypothetical protein
LSEVRSLCFPRSLASLLRLVYSVLLESANFVSLRFCVLDNNIRDIKCVLSCAGLSAQDLPGQIIRPGVAR